MSPPSAWTIGPALVEDLFDARHQGVALERLLGNRVTELEQVFEGRAFFADDGEADLLGLATGLGCVGSLACSVGAALGQLGVGFGATGSELRFGDGLLAVLGCALAQLAREVERSKLVVSADRLATQEDLRRGSGCPVTILSQPEGGLVTLDVDLFERNLALAKQVERRPGVRATALVEDLDRCFDRGRFGLGQPLQLRLVGR